MTTPDPLPGQLPVETRARLDELVRSQLRDLRIVARLADISDPSERALVVDANQLRGEIRRVASSQGDTALVTLARTGFLRMFAAGHVLREVERYLEKRALEMQAEPTAYASAWTNVFRSLLTEVAFSRDLLTPDELRRIEALDRPKPLGDPDDVPTAIAAMILQAPLLSRDELPLIAVYGPDIDLPEQNAYLSALEGGGRVLIVSQWGRSAIVATQVFGVLGSSGVRAIAARTGAAPLILGSLAVSTMALTSASVRAWLGRAKAPLATAAGAILAVYEYYLDAERAYGKLRSPLIGDLGALPDDVADRREAERRAAFGLERAVAPWRMTYIPRVSSNQVRRAIGPVPTTPSRRDPDQVCARLGRRRGASRSAAARCSQRFVARLGPSGCQLRSAFRETRMDMRTEMFIHVLT